MKKKILFIYPKNLKDGQPAKQRIDSFKSFYEDNDCNTYIKEAPVSFGEKLALLKFVYKNKIKNIFISMPPFRNWFLFLLPFVGVIFDIRDGWSIAIKSGYGGNSRPSELKAYITSLFERFAVARAVLTITCTNGLHNYLEKMTSKKILLITNGYNTNDYEIVQKLKNEIHYKKDFVVDTAVCAGQFSEYGKDKVKTILKKISNSNKKTIIKLIGSNKDKNSWIANWLKEKNILNIHLQILPRINRQDMYKEIIQADYGIAVIRDPNYDFGTKVFDYILCEKPIFDYFEDENNFKLFFNKQMHSSHNLDFSVAFKREELISKNREKLIEKLK